MEKRTGAGAYGPRLVGRLTAELIMRSPQYMNCVKQYEIDLRGNKISAIENLGATENQFDSIDLSDNAVVRLDGFPRLTRLSQLLLNNNRVMRIARNLQDSIPSLETLVLTGNRIANLQDIDPLSSLPKLRILSLLGNPVVTKPNYRLYAISKLKHLKVLDFKKVKQKERDAAAKLFPTEEAMEVHGAKTFEPNQEYEQAVAGADQAHKKQQAAEEEQPAAGEDAEMVDGTAVPKAVAAPSQDQLIAIKAAIANAQTMEEIQRLEAALTAGQLPSEVLIDGGAGAAGDKAKPPDTNGAAAMEVG